MADQSNTIVGRRMWLKYGVELINVIYYSLVIGRPAYERQWVESVRSLRRYNQTIPVHLFFYGRLPCAMAEQAAAADVMLHDKGGYRDSFAGHPGQDLLADYPTLHKFRHVSEIAGERLMFLDCDTYFFADPQILFDRYKDGSFYAREEVMTRRSHFGYHPSWIDQEALDRLMLSEGLQPPSPIDPFNTGVFVMNRGFARTLAAHYPEFLSYVHRLLTNEILHVSPDRWIIEEVAMWLTMARIGCPVGIMSRRDVMQGSECAQDYLAGSSAVLAHYWGNGERDFFAGLASGRFSDR